MTSKQTPDSWNMILLVGVICGILAIILSMIFVSDASHEQSKAIDFCNSIGMQYDTLDNSRVCSTDDEDTRYIIKIVYADGQYRLLKSGEKYI